VKTVGTVKWHPPGKKLHRGAWEIMATPDVTIRLKRMFPRSEQKRSRAIVFVDTDEVARDIEWALMRYPMEVDELARARMVAGRQAHIQLEERVLSVLSGEGSIAYDLEPARPPRPHQLVAAKLAMETGRLLLGDVLGLGKTMSCLLPLGVAMYRPAVVVCPTHLPDQWVDELELVYPQLRAHIVKGTRPYDIRLARGMGGRDADVVVVPYSRLAGWADHLAPVANAVLFDEMHELRTGPTTDKYKGAAVLVENTHLAIGATATPVYNYGGEAFNLISLLDPDFLGSQLEFEREWGGGTVRGKTKIKDPKAFGVYLREKGMMLRRDRKDTGREIDELQKITHNCDVDKKKLDQALDGIIALADVILDSKDRGAVFKASGDIDWRVREATGIAKAPYVAEFVKMLLASERKVVLWGWHRQVYRMWADALAAFNPVFYTGKQTQAQKRESVRRFLWQDPDFDLEDPHPRESRVFIQSLRSGAGLNGLQTVCSTGVFGELDWSPKTHDQAGGRLNRDGQIAPPVAFFLVSSHGSDPVIADRLALKRQQSDPIENPDAELFDLSDHDDGSRIRELAQLVRDRRRAA
jgi:hypothetical protein